MAKEHLESLYNVINDSTVLLQKNLKSTTTAALVEIGEDLANGKITREDGLPDETTTAKIQKQFDTINVADYSAEEWRQAIQLVLIRAIEADGIEANKQVTPDALASFASFIIITMLPDLSGDITIADPAVGTGNLLFAVMNQLRAAKKVQPHGLAIDNDEEQLALVAMSADLQDLDTEIFHQDAIDALPFKGADVVISDLPVGYYPVDERAKQFATAAQTGHSYAHHLLIEQSANMLRDGGLGLFYVPSSVFQTDEAKSLTEWMAKNVYFQGLLELPTNFFAQKQGQKSLLVIQKHGGNAKQAPQILLGQFPNLSDRKAFTKFVGDVAKWFDQNIK